MSAKQTPDARTPRSKTPSSKRRPSKTAGAEPPGPKAPAWLDRFAALDHVLYRLVRAALVVGGAFLIMAAGHWLLDALGLNGPRR